MSVSSPARSASIARPSRPPSRTFARESTEPLTPVVCARPGPSPQSLFSPSTSLSVRRQWSRYPGATVPAGRAGFPRPATGTRGRARGFVIRRHPGGVQRRLGSVRELICRPPIVRARPLCVTHPPIRRLPGWLPALSRNLRKRCLVLWRASVTAAGSGRTACGAHRGQCDPGGAGPVPGNSGGQRRTSACWCRWRPRRRPCPDSPAAP